MKRTLPNDSAPRVCVSCSGRRERPASTARAPAPHLGPPLVPELSHLWSSSLVGSRAPPQHTHTPPADPHPVCVIEEKHNPSLPPSVSLYASLPLKSGPRAPPRTGPGRFVCSLKAGQSMWNMDVGTVQVCRQFFFFFKWIFQVEIKGSLCQNRRFSFELLVPFDLKKKKKVGSLSKRQQKLNRRQLRNPARRKKRKCPKKPDL